MGLRIKITQRMVDAAVNVAMNDMERRGYDPDEASEDQVRDFVKCVEEMLRAAADQFTKDRDQ